MSIDLEGETEHRESEQSDTPAIQQDRNMFDVLFGRFTMCFSVFALTISFFLPVDGLGINICWIQQMFELPCPGCGLTRSVTCISQLEFAKSLQYHPFGGFVYAIFVSNVTILIFSKTKQQAKDLFRQHNVVIQRFYLAFVTLFIVFGVCRTLLAYMSQSR